MKQRTWLGWAFGMCLVAPAACSTGERGAERPHGDGGETTAIEATLGEADGCNDDLAEWGNPQTAPCTGAWKYSAYEPCPHIDCGCAQHKSCANWSFGADPVRLQRSFSSTMSVAQTCYNVCLSRNPNDPVTSPAPGPDGAEALCPCGQIEECNPPKWDEAEGKCRQARDAKIAEMRATSTVPPAFDYLIEEVPGSFAFTPLPEGEGGPKAKCAYRIYEPKPATRVDPLCGCATPKTCADDGCPVSGPHWSAPGLSQTALGNGLKDVGKKLYTNSDKPPVCSTCNDKGTKDNANARYACLESFSTQAPQFPTNHLAAVERMQMLVYEKYGYALSDTSQTNWLADARALYSGPASVPACGVSAPDYLCGGMPGPNGPVGVTFDRCLRLVGEHVDQRTVARELAACAETLGANAASFAACVPTAGGPSAAGEAQAALDTLWERQVGPFVTGVSPPTLTSDLGRQVRNFDAWYDAHAKLLTGAAPPNAAQAATLAGDLSAALGRFWGAVDVRFGATKGAVDELTEAVPEAHELRAALTNAFTRGDEGARAVVKAAFTPDAKDDGQTMLPAGGLPLLALLGEALGPLNERLDDQSAFHDFACQFRDCRPTAAASAVVQFYRLLGRLGDPSSFAAALAATPGTLGEWKPALQQLSANRSRLDAAATLSNGGGAAGDLVAQAAAASNLATGLLGGFVDSATFGNRPGGSELPIVLVSFPRPGARASNPLTGPFVSMARVADGTRSAQVWDAIERRVTAPITIYPEDIYYDGSGQVTLTCDQASPVIRGLRFMFGSTASGTFANADAPGGLNGQGRFLIGRAPESQHFTTEVGEVSYLLAPTSAYRNVKGGVLYADDKMLRDSADFSFTNNDFIPPIGLSPFGTYEVDFQGIDAAWASAGGPNVHLANEFVIAMQIDSKLIGGEVPGVSVCGP